MNGRVRNVLVGVAALAILIAFVWQRNSVKHEPEAVNTNTPSVAAQVATNEVPELASKAETNRVSVPPFFLTEANRFIAAATPYGLDNPIKPEDVTYVDDDGRRLMLQTRTHLVEFFNKKGTAPRFHYFIA